MITPSPIDPQQSPPSRPSIGPLRAPWSRTAVPSLVAVSSAAAALIVSALLTAQDDVRSDHRLGATGMANMPIARTAFLGNDNWPLTFSLVFLVVAAALLGYYAVASWRERFLRFELVVFAALMCVSVIDPLGNWATSASFDPRFLHFPTSLPWVNIAPGIEPLMVVVGYPFLFLTIALLARAVARRTPVAQMSGRREIAAVALIGLSIGAALDTVAQLFMMNAHMYVYLRHCPPALVWGDAVVPWLPVLYDSSGIAITTVLLWWASERNASRAPARLADFARYWLALSAVLIIVIAAAGILRLLGFVDATFAGPWPFPEMIDGRPMPQ